MISTIILTIWICAGLVPIFVTADGQSNQVVLASWIIWVLSASLWIVPIFTGLNVQNNQGQYTGYVASVEQNGTIFKGWNVYLKTELESSDSDRACINREDAQLIEDLKKAQENKESVTVEYKGVWQFKIGECPNATWMVTKIK